MNNNSVRRNVSSDRISDQISLFHEGDSATPLDTIIMNEIIRAINRNSNVIGANGIKVTKSDSNIVISFDANLLVNSGSLGSGGSGNTTNNYTNTQCQCRYA